MQRRFHASAQEWAEGIEPSSGKSSPTTGGSWGVEPLRKSPYFQIPLSVALVGVEPTNNSPHPQCGRFSVCVQRLESGDEESNFGLENISLLSSH